MSTLSLDQASHLKQVINYGEKKLISYYIDMFYVFYKAFDGQTAAVEIISYV